MTKGIALLITATILWGGNYVSGRYLADALPPTLLNTVRWGISTVLLAGLLALNKKRLPLFTKWKELSLLGFLGIFGFSTLTYLGLQSVSASQAGMISAGIPIAILLFTPLVLKERIRGKSWLGAFVSIAGVIVLFLGKGGTGPASEASFLGDLEIMLSCVAWGLYTVLGKRYGKEIDPLTMTAGAAFYGTLFSAISCIGTVRPEAIHMSGTAWLCLAYVSTFASVGAYLAWTAGVRTVGPGSAAPYINLLPVWTVVFGVLLLNESISWVSLIGGLLTIIGAVVASL